MNKQSIYGDPNNIAVFDLENPNEKKHKKQKILCNESYRDELLSAYENFEEGNINSDNFDLSTGSNINGTIVSINQNDIVLDIGAKYNVYISVEKEKVNLEDFSIGDELNVSVISTKGNFIKGSMVEYTRAKIYEEMRSTGEKSIYAAKVLELSENGYILDIQGVKVFMPGSLGGINKLLDFSSLVGKTINVMTVNNNNKYSKFKDQLIVSHRDYLKTLIPEEIEKLEIGSVYTGAVTDTTKFGVFIEFAVDANSPTVLTGLIHKDDFDELLLELFDTKQVQPGTKIDFYLKEVVSNSRIILSRNVLDTEKEEKNAIKKGDIIKGRITHIVKYGAFVSLGNKKSGLIHINKIEDISKLNQGDSVDVKILDIQGNKYDLDIV